MTFRFLFLLEIPMNKLPPTAATTIIINESTMDASMSRVDVMVNCSTSTGSYVRVCT